jgi:para-aminobenzoate synthetase/4-amino-4-deoxychorismate lyase
MRSGEGVEARIRVEGEWVQFARPVSIRETRAAAEVVPLVNEVERVVRSRGWHAVGFLTYEAAGAFGLPVCPPDPNLPLAWFALFDRARPAPPGSRFAAHDAGYELDALRHSVDRRGFQAAFDRIKRHLADGDCYQVNYTFQVEGRFRGDPLALFEDLHGAQQGAHAAYLHVGSHSICSASPELFFSRVGDRVVARPMKGTAARGRTSAEDGQQRDDLRASEKERAENVMIVDMVRNDLGRVAKTGSIAVPELFVAERYPNVWQMTSLVTGTSERPLGELFAAMHPSASVTGAPKVRTMDILCGLEQRPRGVYTGAIGHVGPDGAASFSVAIRTAVVDHAAATVQFGIGSGIVWDSDAQREYDECLLKGSVLGRRPPSFELLETLRWAPGEGFLLLERHLARVCDSAGYFGFSCDATRLTSALDEGVSGSTSPLRVRLLVSRDGGVRVETFPLGETKRRLRVDLAAAPVDPRDVFLFHKTTNRDLYERARTATGDETILWNAGGCVTEATTANIVVELDGERVTPPIECGLLAGTFRAELLQRGQVRERTVTIADLRRAPALWLVNSVHGWRTADLVA